MKMPDLEQRFRTLDGIRVPDLRPDIRSRSPGRLRGAVPWSRVGTAAVALVVAAAGTYAAVRTFLDRSPERPAVSPPAGRIAFVVRTGGPDMIHLAGTDGSGITPLVQGRDPAWSPDGSRLAYRSGGGPQSRIGVVDADGTDARVLYTVEGEPAAAGPPVWSPDGRQLAFAAGDGIYVMRTDGSDPRRISQYRGSHACYDLQPSWSPDGAMIAFAVRCEGGDLGVFVMNADGSGRTRLTGTEAGPDAYPPYDDFYPVWSPEGSRIAFIRRTAPAPTDAYRWDLMVMNPDGSSLRRIARGPYQDRPDWSPDGGHLVIADPFEGHLYAVEAQSGDTTRLALGEVHACCSSWQPTPSGAGMTAAPALQVHQPLKVGKFAFSISAGEGSAWVAVDNDIVRIDAETGEKVTVLEDARLDAVIAAGSLWTASSGEDGVVVERIDPTTLETLATIDLRPFDGYTIASMMSGTDEGVALALAENKRGGSWALARIEPASNQVAWTVSLDGVVDFPPGTSNRILTELEQGEGSVWATMWGLGGKGVRAGFVLRLDEQTGAILDTPEVGHSGRLAVGAGAVWTVKEGFGPVRIDVQSGELTPIDVPGFEPFAVSEGGVWFMDRTGTGIRLGRLNTETLQAEFSVAIPSDPDHGLVAQEAVLDESTDTIWVLNENATVTRVEIVG
jgi:hypothetical protein